MKKSTIILQFSGLAACLFVTLIAPGLANPLDGVVDRFAHLGRRVEADPDKDYPLEVSHGPWLITVATFSGETAQADAKTLALELRAKYKLNAYVFDKAFVHQLAGHEARGLTNRPLNYRTKGNNHEYAVLVGDFQSVNEDAFRKALERIKSLEPDCLKPGNRNGTRTASQKLASIVLPPNVTKRPLTSAFGVPNPLQPPQYRRGIVDPFIEKINSVSEYSLLDNPGLYTVCVATFTGKVEIRQSEIQDFLKQKEQGRIKEPTGPNTDPTKETALERAGKDAVRLCAILRAKGYEAYEFHDRYSSIVTVGAYDAPGTRMPDGHIELRPEIIDLFNRFTAQRVDPRLLRGAQAGTINYKPVSIDGIECDVQPKIIQVPKRPTTARR